MSLTIGSDVPASVWETPLGRWRLAWVAHLNGQPIEAPVAPPVETADEAFAREIALAHEVCDDEIDADAAVGVMPPAALVYAEPGADA